MPAPSTAALFDRPALVARLRSALAKPLTVIHAPAGYGKTSAATLAVRSTDLPTAWYLAQPWHAGDFIEPLVAAVRETRDEFGRLTLAAAQSEQTSAKRLGATFAQELNNLPDPLVLVLDDVQCLSEDPVFTEFLTALMRALPDHVHLLVLARVMPQVPVAADVARGRATVFDTSDLRFDAEETLQIAGAFGTPIDVTRAQALCELCEGWPTAVTLSLTMGGKLVPSTHGLQSALGAYLLEELIDTMPADVAGFLEQTAVLESIDVSALEQGTIPGARALLTACERLGVLLAVVRPGALYRVHPLLRETLLRRMQQARGESAVQDAHRWAARLYERLGEPRPALYHYNEARDDRGIAAVLEAYAFDLISAGNANFVEALLDRIPPQAAHPALRPFVEALIAKQRGKAHARRLFESAEAALDARAGAAFAFNVQHQHIEQQLTELEAPGQARLDALLQAATPLGKPAECDALTVAGWAALLRGDSRGANAIAEDAFARSLPGTTARFRIAILGTYAATLLGEFERADGILGALLRTMENSEQVALQCSTLAWYARLSLLWGDTVGALEYALEAERMARTIEIPSELAAAYFALVEAYMHLGDLEHVRAAAAQMHKSAEQAWYVADRQRAHVFAEQCLARAEYRAGNTGRAFELAMHLSGSPEIAPLQRALVSTDAAAYAALLGNPSANALQEAVRELLSAAAPRDATEAVALSDAYELAGVAEAPANAFFEPLLLRRNTLRGRSPHFQTAILEDLARARDGAKRPLVPQPQPVSPREALTKRESEILELLAGGLTNKEMAARLVLSPRTVESHVERILGKLGVTSRSRAVATALRTGLVTSEVP